MVCEEKPQVPEEPQQTPPEEPQQTPPEEPQETPSKESEEAPAETEESQYLFWEGVRWAVWLPPVIDFSQNL